MSATESDRVWRLGVSRLQSVIDVMASGGLSSQGASKSLARQAMASLRERNENIETWAERLASQVSDLND